MFSNWQDGTMIKEMSPYLGLGPTMMKYEYPSHYSNDLIDILINNNEQAPEDVNMFNIRICDPGINNHQQVRDLQTQDCVTSGCLSTDASACENTYEAVNLSSHPTDVYIDEEEDTPPLSQCALAGTLDCDDVSDAGSWLVFQNDDHDQRHEWTVLDDSWDLC